MQLKAFTNEQGANFLLSLLDNFASPSQTDKEAAISVSQRFNGLPLGLRQAAYFMRKKKCLPAAFLDLYNQKHDGIERFHIPGYTNTVADVWEMSMNTLTRDAADLLDILTLLDPDAIPIQMFRSYGRSTTFSSFLDDDARYYDTTECLADQSLIDVNLRDDKLSLHRFFLEATFRRLKVQTARFQNVYCATVEMVNQAVPKDDYLSLKHHSAWQAVQTNIAHVDVLYARASSICNQLSLELVRKDCWVRV